MKRSGVFAVDRENRKEAAVQDLLRPSVYIADEDSRIEEEELLQMRRRRRRELLRQRRARQVRRQRRMAMFAVLFSIVVIVVGTQTVMHAYAKSRLSSSVLRYRKTVEKYAAREGISKHVDTLMAIMMVESAGKGEDVMQSSESKGLPRNSLKPKESIKQACVYYAALIRMAKTYKIKDKKVLIQAYNFGPGYISYVAKKGKVHTQKLATAYSKKMSGGRKVAYLNLYAIQKNGGWRYNFGNMFYVALVQRYL